MTFINSNYYIYGMAYVFLILISIAGLALCGFYLKKNIIRIKEKNKDEALTWLRRSANAGYDAAYDMLSDLEDD